MKARLLRPYERLQHWQERADAERDLIIKAVRVGAHLHEASRVRVTLYEVAVWIPSVIMCTEEQKEKVRQILGDLGVERSRVRFYHGVAW